MRTIYWDEVSDNKYTTSQMHVPFSGKNLCHRGTVRDPTSTSSRTFYEVSVSRRYEQTFNIFLSHNATSMIAILVAMCEYKDAVSNKQTIAYSVIEFQLVCKYDCVSRSRPATMRKLQLCSSMRDNGSGLIARIMIYCDLIPRLESFILIDAIL